MPAAPSDLVEGWRTTTVPDRACLGVLGSEVKEEAVGRGT